MIPLFKPYMHQPAVNEAVCKVLSYREDGSLYCGEGPLVKEFERRFAALVGADPATVVAVNSCSSALALALQLVGVEGGEVISTPMTCTATNEAIVNAGARIVWADISPETGNIDPADVARKVTKQTRAIVAVDWGGRTVNGDGKLREAGRYYKAGNLIPHYIPLIEDAAHALCATAGGADGERLGCFTQGADHYICYSFGPIKHLTCGDGGAVIVPARHAPRARKLRWHSLDRESSADFRCAQTIEEPGHKWHLTDLNAAIGLANLPHAEWVVARHRANAAFYDRALANLHGVTLPPTDEGSSYWCYFLLTDDRDGFQAHMAARGIATSPVHARNDTHPAYHFPNGPLPGVDHYAARACAIPVGWWVTEEERHNIANAVIEWACFREGWVAA